MENIKRNYSIDINHVDVYSYQKIIVEHISKDINNLSEERRAQFVNWLSTEIADIASNINDLELTSQQPYFQIIDYLSKPLDEIHNAELKKVKH